MTDDARAPHVPNGYEPESVDYVADPHGALQEMHADGRIHHRIDRLGTTRYVMTHYEDVRSLLRDRDNFLDVRKLGAEDPRRLGVLPEENERLGEQPSILGLDDPEHGRLRNLLNRAFTPRAVDAMSPQIEEIADGLLDEVEDEAEIDFMRAVADPLPAMVIATMLGVPPEERDQFKEWSLAINNSTIDPEDVERIRIGRTATESLRSYFDRAVSERREDPRDDLMSALIEAEDEGDRMSHDEVLTMLNLLLLAGNLTTTDLMGNGLAVLLSHPDEVAKLREDPSVMANAVEEMLRYTPPVLESGRMTGASGEVGGCPLPEHASVNVSLMGANRDPDFFEDPHEFDVTREAIPHQSFGGGIHFCLGATLARNEARIGLERLFERYEEIELAVPYHRLEWRGGGAFRGLRSLPLPVTPRRLG